MLCKVQHAADTRSPFQGGVGLGSSQSSRLSRTIFLVCVNFAKPTLCAFALRQAGIYGSTTAGQKKNLAVVEMSSFDFFNTRKVLCLSELFD